MSDQPFSFQQAAWKKLRQHKTAMAGLLIIVLAILVAFFAYWLAPDHSPNANRMMVEIGGKHPGYTQLFLAIKKTDLPEKPGMLQRTISGETDQFQYIPINDFEHKGDSLIIQQYGGTITHQHGVGTDHATYLPAEKGTLGIEALRAVCKSFDPDEMMNPGKLLIE